MTDAIPNDEKQWYALRDLKRPNALMPAYKQLSQLGIEVFTPMKWRLVKNNGKYIRKETAIIPNLLFAHETRERLNPIILETPTLQYRYKRGAYCEPIVVPNDDMDRFINAVNATDDPKFYSLEELNQIKLGQTIRVIGGPMGGQEGKLKSIRGSKSKWLIIELPNLIAVSIKITDYIQLQVL